MFAKSYRCCLYHFQPTADRSPVHLVYHLVFHYPWSIIGKKTHKQGDWCTRRFPQETRQEKSREAFQHLSALTCCSPVPSLWNSFFHASGSLWQRRESGSKCTRFPALWYILQKVFLRLLWWLCCWCLKLFNYFSPLFTEVDNYESTI